MKWILNCIVDHIWENINYKPKEIMRDLEQEYGDIVLNQGEVQGVENPMNDVLDQQRKKPLKGSPGHCNFCKKTGHNKRTHKTTLDELVVLKLLCFYASALLKACFSPYSRVD
ncbi:hypothetical protein FEM48_Zijuj05G0123800 [Ziziphus jujuba var. spinosa]|uniref:Uncharacterized protein n=1 Tax=Ziziphus jujuba var. spinosa TaxID=714518 RepID=A0A978VET2_ZIZJJ|nr:hypothetical protein FEM48_Zijuj05G0123800 [Ziziphus jujuba var. spinosa]